MAQEGSSGSAPTAPGATAIRRQLGGHRLQGSVHEAALDTATAPSICQTSLSSAARCPTSQRDSAPPGSAAGAGTTAASRTSTQSRFAGEEAPLAPQEEAIWGHEEIQPDGKGDTNQQGVHQSSRGMPYSCPKASARRSTSSKPRGGQQKPSEPWGTWRLQGPVLGAGLAAAVAAEGGGGLGGPPPSWERSWCRRMSFPSSPHRGLPGNTTCQRDAGGPVTLSPLGAAGP